MPPSFDGGSPITGYTIEKREKSRQTWIGTGTTNPKTTEFSVGRLFEGTTYFFRVAAENEVGTSDFVEMDKGVTPKALIGLLSNNFHK